MSDPTDVARVVAEMSASTTARTDRDWKAAEKVARQEQIAAEAEADKRSANAMLDVQEERNRKFRYSNLGTLSDGELRRLIRNDHGFEPI
jgi:hypothetical protein